MTKPIVCEACGSNDLTCTVVKHEPGPSEWSCVCNECGHITTGEFVTEIPAAILAGGLIFVLIVFVYLLYEYNKLV